MKTYFIDKIETQNVNITANGLNDLALKAIRHVEHSSGRIALIYVHCSHIVTGGDKWSDEQDVEYRVRVNNQKRTITTERI